MNGIDFSPFNNIFIKCSLLYELIDANTDRIREVIVSYFEARVGSSWSRLIDVIRLVAMIGPVILSSGAVMLGYRNEVLVQLQGSKRIVVIGLVMIGRIYLIVVYAYIVFRRVARVRFLRRLVREKFESLKLISVREYLDESYEETTIRECRESLRVLSGSPYSAIRQAADSGSSGGLRGTQEELEKFINPLA